MFLYMSHNWCSSLWKIKSERQKTASLNRDRLQWSRIQSHVTPSRCSPLWRSWSVRRLLSSSGRRTFLLDCSPWIRVCREDLPKASNTTVSLPLYFLIILFSWTLTRQSAEMITKTGCQFLHHVRSHLLKQWRGFGADYAGWGNGSVQIELQKYVGPIVPSWVETFFFRCCLWLQRLLCCASWLWSVPCSELMKKCNPSAVCCYRKAINSQAWSGVKVTTGSFSAISRASHAFFF